MKRIVIAIDGFSSLGKSTMAKDLAKEIGYIYIDSGAMYRAVTLYCLRNGFFILGELDEEKLKNNLDNINISFKLSTATGTPETYLNGENVEKEIRSMEVSNKVSIISAIGFVRRKMVAIQQGMGKEKGIVMDGRDIGTVVFPNAELKVFTTASIEIRAQRRLNELRTKGDQKTTFEQVCENIKERDYLDQNRAESPLKKADDAVLLDNTEMTREQQVQWLLNKFYSIVNE